MNIQAIYDRLHRDVCNKLGEIPRLQISRAPQYEDLWKRLLTAIEEMGESTGTNVSATSYNAWPKDQAGSIDSDTCRVYFGTTLWSSLPMDVPVELARLVVEVLGRACPTCMQLLRQVCLFTYKSKSHEVTKKQEDDAIQGFRDRNLVCRGLSWAHYQREAGASTELGEILRLSRLLVNIATMAWDVRDISPRHGPGAVSDAKKAGASKWRALDGACCRITDKMYPISEFFTPTPAWFDHRAARFVDPICKLTIVPKDRRGPRVICTQPTGLMWVQQGQRRGLERCIESSSLLRVNRHIIGGPACSIKFDRQENNGELALESSRTREFATIDLKDASDLVSWGLVRFLFNKETISALAASRSTHVAIKGQVERLHMYAPMGSAMCFPIESLVFWAVSTAACYVQRSVTYKRLQKEPYRLTKWLNLNLREEVFVFGDDILVRSELCEHVCRCLNAVGFRINRGKTFYKGFYREACGVDGFHGRELKIARLQNVTLTSMSDAYALIDFCNRSRALGMTSLADHIEREVEAFLGFRLAAGLTGGSVWSRGWPCTREGAAAALSWNLRRNTRIRFNTRYQYFEAQTVVCRPFPLREPEDDRCRLFRALTVGVSRQEKGHNAAGDEHTVDWIDPDNQQYHLGWVKAF